MNFLSFFTIFRLWEEHSATLAQKLWKSCQICILLEQQNFSRKVCFLKKIFTFSSFDEKLCRLPPESLPPGLKNCFLHPFSGFSCITLPFPSRKFTVTNNFDGKCLEVGKKIFDMVVKTALFAFRWYFWRNFFFPAKSSNFAVFFRLWGKLSGFLAKIIWLGCQKCFQVSRGYFWKSRFWKQFFWIVSLFLDFGNNLFGLSAKIFDRSFKIAFYVSGGDFWLDCFF